MNVYLLTNMAAQHGAGTQTPRIKSRLANAISSFSFIITLLTAMEYLSVLKPLSVKLQKRDIDVYEAYTNRTSATTSKTSGPSGSNWRSLPRQM